MIPDASSSTPPITPTTTTTPTTSTAAPSPAFPDVTRPGVGTVLAMPRWTGTPERQRQVADALLAQWHGRPLPEGFISLAVFASTDGEDLLTYAQWTTDEAHRAYVREHPPTDPDEATDPVRYHLYRSANAPEDRGPGDIRTPSCLATAAFDVDGRERQQYFVEALTDALPGGDGRGTGALGAYFHLSTDGTRVFSYTEWTDEQASIDAEGSKAYDRLRAVSSGTPGVRPVRGRRYRLYGGFER